MSEEAAQPADEGQGADSQGNDLYSGFLEGIPEEIHEQVIPALKAQDASFTKRFQSLSERTKPFEELGVFDRDPEVVGGFLGLASAIEAAAGGDEEAGGAVREWWDQLGEQMGFYESGESEGDESDDEFDPFDRDQIASLLQQEIQNQIGPVQEFIEHQTQEQAVYEAEQAIEQRISELKSENPDLSDEVIEEILGLAEMFVDESDDPIGEGFKKYQALVSKGESQLFANKQQQPGVPESSGPANTAPPMVTSENVQQMARERLSKQRELIG